MFGILVESGPDLLMILEGSLAISRNMGLSNLLLTNSQKNVLLEYHMI